MKLAARRGTGPDAARLPANTGPAASLRPRGPCPTPAVADDMSCDIHAHTPAQKSYINFILYLFVS